MFDEIIECGEFYCPVYEDTTCCFSCSYRDDCNEVCPEYKANGLCADYECSEMKRGFGFERWVVEEEE